MAGKVLNRAGLALGQTHYDYVVLGGGLLGLACAFYLRTFQPEASLLIVEQDGIPSETGATHVSPAVLGTSGEQKQEALWTRAVLNNLPDETGVSRPHDKVFQPSGLLELLAEKTADSVTTETALAELPPTQRDTIRELVDTERTPHALFDARGGYGSAEAVALHYGHGAVKRGADLLLNARALPLSENEICLERLEFDRYMKRVVVKKERLSAGEVIVALGASTAAFLEEALGSLLPYRRVYRQYLRIEVDVRLPTERGRVQLPVLQAHGFTLRPQGEGLLVIPPSLPPDPEGYEPKGANLMGVRVGVRREVLEQLMDATEGLPALAWESLNLGKTVEKVRGAWGVITPDGLPTWQRVEDSGWYALVGGEQGFGLGLSTAYDLAASLSSRAERPWQT